MIRLLVNKYALGNTYELQEKIDGKWVRITLQTKLSAINKICDNQNIKIDKKKVHSHIY